MSFYNKRSYQREHLRALYKEFALYSEGDHVYKAKAINLSEGGILLEQVPYFPEDSKHLSFKIKIPFLPQLKSFSLEKLRSFSAYEFKSKIIDFEAQMVRKDSIQSQVDAIFSTNIACKITSIQGTQRQLIREYVQSMLSNIVLLQTLLEQTNYDESAKQKSQMISEILGYEKNLSFSMLYKNVMNDYRNLQWL